MYVIINEAMVKICHSIITALFLIVNVFQQLVIYISSEMRLEWHSCILRPHISLHILPQQHFIPTPLQVG